MNKLIFILLVFSIAFSNVSFAHRSGCHRWHSCPSDIGSYICGDRGHCNYCPDNQFCQDRKPILKNTPSRNFKNQRVNSNSDLEKEVSEILNPTSQNLKEYAIVDRVVDGDTILVYGEKIRLLNVDTEESVHPDKRKNTVFGKTTSNYVRSVLEKKVVTLECEGKGRFGRKLCNVFLDGELFNARLVEEGWSKYYRKYGDSKNYHELFVRKQKLAKSNKLGVWKTD